MNGLVAGASPVTAPTPAEIRAKKAAEVFLTLFAKNGILLTPAQWPGRDTRASGIVDVEVFGKIAVLPHVTEDDKARNKQIFNLLKGFSQKRDKDGFDANSDSVDEKNMAMRTNLVTTIITGNNFTVGMTGEAKLYIADYVGPER